MLNILKMLILSVAGILLLIYPSQSLYTIMIILGIALICYGVFSIAAFGISRIRESGMKKQSEKSLQQGKFLSLLIGIIAFGAGIFVLLRSSLVRRFFPQIVAVFVIIAGIALIAEAIGRRKSDVSWGSSLSVAAATIILGGIILFRPFDEGTIVRILGTVMLYMGASGIVPQKRLNKTAENTDVEKLQ